MKVTQFLSLPKTNLNNVSCQVTTQCLYLTVRCNSDNFRYISTNFTSSYISEIHNQPDDCPTGGRCNNDSWLN